MTHWHPITEVDFPTGADFVRDGRYFVTSGAVYLTPEEGAKAVAKYGGETDVTACRCPSGENVRDRLAELRRKIRDDGRPGDEQ